LTCNEPEGAFYAFPNVSGCFGRTIKTSAQFADRLLEQEQTVVTEGGSFGAEGYIRMSYATSMEQLREGVTRLKRFVERCRQ
jgi:aspartate aminotransferase